MDLTQAVNAPEVIDFGGRPFPVRQLRLVEWGGLQAWLKRALPDPLSEALRKLAALKADGVDVDAETRTQVLEIATAASRSWPPRVGSKRWLAALDEAEGGAVRFVHLALTAGGAPLDLAGAEALNDRATDAEFAELIRVAYLGEPARPKAPAPSTSSSTGPAATTPRARKSRTTGGPSSTA